MTIRGTGKALSTWLAAPFTRAGRQGLSWYVSNNIPQTVHRSGALPQISWSQDGEDFLFEELFPHAGRYVDVGAHHPDRFSVTRKLYDRGWQGVNIDFSPGFSEIFARSRPRDTNIQALVGRQRLETFWRFREPTLSTLDAARAHQLLNLGWELESEEPVSVSPLTRILSDSGFTGPIDLLSVDVEGEDLEVLRSLDWERWPVDRCLVEIVLPAYEVPDHPVAQFVMGKGLRLTRVWGRSCLFERNFTPDELAR